MEQDSETELDSEMMAELDEEARIELKRLSLATAKAKQAEARVKALEEAGGAAGS